MAWRGELWTHRAKLLDARAKRLELVGAVDGVAVEVKDPARKGAAVLFLELETLLFPLEAVVVPEGIAVAPVLLEWESGGIWRPGAFLG